MHFIVYEFLALVKTGINEEKKVLTAAIIKCVKYMLTEMAYIVKGKCVRSILKT